MTPARGSMEIGHTAATRRGFSSCGAVGDLAAHRVCRVGGGMPDSVDDAAQPVADAPDQRIIGLVEAVLVMPCAAAMSSPQPPLSSSARSG